MTTKRGHIRLVGPAPKRKAKAAQTKPPVVDLFERLANGAAHAKTAKAVGFYIDDDGMTRFGVFGMTPLEVIARLELLKRRLCRDQGA